MIKVNEVRMGNWLYDMKLDRNIRLKSCHGFCYIDSRPEEFLPISLIPEILEKCGFELHSKYSYHNYKTKNNFFVSIWMEDEPFAGFEKKGMCYWGDNFLEVPYLHQLQNLYYALTGEELNVKL